MTPIAYIHSPYKEKFGTPRQSGLIQCDYSQIVFEPEFRNLELTRGLEQMSHMWVIFHFHQVKYEGHNMTIRPPRLGGKERVGIMASRTPHRPNQLGLSLVNIHSVEKDRLHFLGGDMVHRTPVFDIKPYHPQADRPDFFQSGYIEQLQTNNLDVEWKINKEIDPELKHLITEVISQDPRPASQKNTFDKKFGVMIKNKNIIFSVIADIAFVEFIEEVV